MATDYKLTWVKQQNGRWRKKYKGIQYYFPRREGESKESSYTRCLKEWEKKKQEIDAGPKSDRDYERGLIVLIERTKATLAELAAVDTPANRENWNLHRQCLLSLESYLRIGIDPFSDGDDMDNPPDFAPWGISSALGDDDSTVYDRPPWWVPGPPKLAEENTISACAKRFLGRKELQAKRGERSAGRVEVLRVGLNSFVAMIGGDQPITAVTTAVLSRYRDELEKLISDETIRPHSARDRLQSVKQFVRWAWEEELIGLPRILESREFSIALPEQKITTFTDAEVKRLLAASSDSTRLYLLLMLNCGMTQIDIAELTQNEVDWDKGRVTRKRSKTRKSANDKQVPTVSYVLWPETFRLLKANRSKHPTLALTNVNGEPLKVESITDGRAAKKDNIRSAYCRVIVKLANAKTDPIKIDKQLKLLRKTAATKLGKHPEYSRFAQYFLGHAPNTVADRHYVAPSEEQFDAAVTWLGTQFSIVS